MTINLDIDTLAQAVAERLADALPGEERLLTIEQAADRLAISKTTLLTLIASGDMPTVGQGKLRRVRLGALRDWMLSHERRK